MPKLNLFICSILCIFYLSKITICQEIPEVSVGTKLTINVAPNKASLYNFAIAENQLEQGKFFVFSTKPVEYLKPAFIYISLTSEKPPSPDNRNFSSQEAGKNIIFINKALIADQKGEKKYLYICINSLVDTTVEFEINFINNVSLNDYEGIRPKLKLEDISNLDIISYTYHKAESEKQKKILFYSLSEKYNYFKMIVQIRYQDSKIKEYNVERRFENGYGAIVDFNNENFLEEQEKIIYIIITSLDDNYKNKKIELGYEIIDGNDEYIREVNIMEHIYGMTEKSETCYNIKDRDISELNGSIMLINIFSQSLEFNI